MTAPAKRKTTPPKPTTPTGDAPLTEVEARALLGDVAAELGARAATRPLSIAESLDPRGVNGLGLALIERALDLFGDSGTGALLGVLWAIRSQNDLDALGLDAVATRRRVAALAIQFTTTELTEHTDAAERLLAALFKTPPVEVTVREVGDAEPELVARPGLVEVLLEPSSEQLAAGQLWRNSTARRLVVRRALPGVIPGEVESEGSSTAASSSL